MEIRTQSKKYLVIVELTCYTSIYLHLEHEEVKYHHGAAMGQKNVKVCRSLQQFGDEKPVNVTVCRDFHRLSIPASGTE